MSTHFGPSSHRPSGKVCGGYDSFLVLFPSEWKAKPREVSRESLQRKWCDGNHRPFRGPVEIGKWSRHVEWCYPELWPRAVSRNKLNRCKKMGWQSGVSQNQRPLKKIYVQKKKTWPFLHFFWWVLGVNAWHAPACITAPKISFHDASESIV